MSQTKRSIISLILVLVASVIFISILSFNAADISFIHKTTKSIKTVNALGHFGANIASYLLFYFGGAAFLLVSILLLAAFFAYKPWYFSDNIDRFFSIILLMPIFSALLNLYSFDFKGVYPGGLIGLNLNCFFSLFLERNHIFAFLFVLVWALFIVIYRFAFSHMIFPLCKIIRALPYKTIWQYVNSGIYQFISYAKHAFVTIVDKLTQDLSDNDPQINKIYTDPFWTLYSKEDISEIEQTITKQIDVSYDTQDIITDKDLTIYEDSNEYTFEINNDINELENNSMYNEDNEFIESEQENIYILPDLKDFSVFDNSYDEFQKQESQMRATILEDKLSKFGIQGKVISIVNGPVVTLFEYQPAVETKISNILARENDLALALQALSLRIIAPIPGKSVVGFEVAHTKRRSVLYGELIASKEFQGFKGILPLILGKDTLGNNVIIDLIGTPHLLVAGSTGSGKSVCMNAMLMSLLCSKTPEELKMILIDPKRLEFAQYADIAHLLFPIVTESSKAILVLRWAIKTMEDRYNVMARSGVRNISEYRLMYPDRKNEMPYIVIMIDELADLMMTAGKDVEHLIARLAQMARASGIHMIVATQRPSVDIITGLIKVNFPSRIAFKVASKIDSRTILDDMGAEKLLGKGDMLFLDSKGGMYRVHGAYVTDDEIQKVVNHIKDQQHVEYEEFAMLKSSDCDAYEDELYDEVLKYVNSKDEISISLIQRVFRIGYNRSARIIDQLENDGYILPTDGSKMRKVCKERYTDNNVF